ncbi:hypothetical protein Sme01_50430 [Sphaerisporangium melleum]|uniref:non-specific serine/threonine protein kinase n=1 Tax=Sphaerisporangium melleum TaxID=321316 RepID=A0A917R570_9ACTN|nr:protein kinase [Sphaerisporangium melleum]GGK90001.1 hypothetical protein GCM10007964_35840 [Sphaerisporangium melleum]GII72567.1 hypothetical protein Sme01_50430 [Sphaerisporangium melleum]
MVAEPGAPQVPGYEVLGILGQGGFGVVYRARQLAVRREVALKVDNRVLVSERDQRRFMREVSSAGALSGHPHVADVYDAGVLADGRPYMVLELCPGGSLADRLRAEGPLAPAEVRDIGVRIGDALAAAHMAGVLHRDVKPANILINGYGMVALTDFGLAAAAHADGDMSATRESLTPAFGPPEAFELAAPAPAGDVYSLAATLYALLNGRPPRFPENGVVNIAMIMALHRLPIPEIAGVPRELTAVLRAGMATDPRARIPSAADLRDALAAIPAGILTSAGGNRPGPSSAPLPAAASGPGGSGGLAANSGPGGGTGSRGPAWAGRAEATGPGRAAEATGPGDRRFDLTGPGGRRFEATGPDGGTGMPGPYGGRDTSGAPQGAYAVDAPEGGGSPGPYGARDASGARPGGYPMDARDDGRAAHGGRSGPGGRAGAHVMDAPGDGAGGRSGPGQGTGPRSRGSRAALPPPPAARSHAQTGLYVAVAGVFALLLTAGVALMVYENRDQGTSSGVPANTPAAASSASSADPRTPPGTTGSASSSPASPPAAGTGGAFGAVPTSTASCPATTVAGAGAACVRQAECWGNMTVINGAVSINRRDCREDHTWETFAIAPLPTDGLTSDRNDLAGHPVVKRLCSKRILLASRIGEARSVEATRWLVEALPPSPQAFEQGVRVYRCVGAVMAEKVQGPYFRPLT